MNAPAPRLIHCAAALRWFDPFTPIALIIGHAYGISYYEMFLLQGIGSLTILLCDPLAGMIADYFGRRSVLVMSSVFFSVGNLIFLSYPSFLTWGFAVVFLGLGIAFYSGADTALLFEICQSRRGCDYRRQEGCMQSVSRWSEAVSAGLAFVAMFDLRLPIILALVSKLILLLLFLYALPPEQSRRVVKYSPRQLLKQLSYVAVIKTLHADRRQRPKQHAILLTLFFYAACQSMILINIYWAIQQSADVSAFPLAGMSIFWFFYFVVCGCMSRLSNRLRLPGSSMIFLSVLSACLLLCASFLPPLYRMVPLFLFALIYGLMMPLVNGLINHYSLVRHRVLMHSCSTALMRLIYAISVVFIGYLVEYYSLPVALLGLLLPALVCLLLGFRFVYLTK